MSEFLNISKNAKYYIATFVLAVTTLWTLHSVANSNRIQRLKQSLKSKSSIQSQTIILAFEPEQLFVKMRHEEQLHLKSLKSSRRKGVVGTIINLFKSSAQSYEEKITGRNLRNLIKELKQCREVRLMIYTKLEKQICEQILDNFGVSSYFEPKNRVYMQSEHKSADELDCDTGRVVVISAIKEDHRDCIMSNTHNLILDIGQERLEGVLLANLRYFLMELVGLGRGDSLHEDMYELALNWELPVWNDQNDSI